MSGQELDWAWYFAAATASFLASLLAAYVLSVGSSAQGISRIGTCGEFSEISAYLDRFSKLYPVGRNSMHRYSNQDHSMLAAKRAGGSMITGGVGKRKIWHINGEDSYHEEIRGPT